MLKSSLKILVLFLLVQCCLPRESQANEKTKTIVIFFSLHAGLPAYQNLLEGFRTTFSEEYNEHYNLLIEYLDIGRLSDGQYAKYIVENYNAKYKYTDIDLLITVSPGIIPVLKKYGFEALGRSNTISIELDSLAADQGLLPAENVLKINLKSQFEQSIKTACSLFPSCENIYIISGCSPTDKYFTSMVRRSTMNFDKGKNFVYITDLTLDSTIRVMTKMPTNSIVIIPTYLSDKNGLQFSTPEVIGLLSAYCSCPIFPLFDSFIRREGGIGGYVFSYNSVGKETGRAAMEILHGKKPAEVLIHEDSFYQNIFDWRVLKKKGLLKSKALPANSIYFYKEYNFVTDYLWYILASFLFLLLETLLIIYLYKLSVRQKAIVKQMTETENLHRILVREERLMMMVELTASLSHELSQPLTAILYNAQACIWFLKSEKPDLERVEEILLKIIKDDKRAGNLISSVRSLMKLETRNKEWVGLDDIIQDSLSIFESEAIHRQIKIVNLPPAIPFFVLGDIIQLEQVLLNFLNNASQALESIDADKRVIEISQHIVKDMVEVAVRDTGPGINEEVKANLFKPFVTSRENGFGIGLAVSRSIIENHKGEIGAENIPGSGAEFYFRLKIRTDEDEG